MHLRGCHFGAHFGATLRELDSRIAAHILHVSGYRFGQSLAIYIRCGRVVCICVSEEGSVRQPPRCIAYNEGEKQVSERVFREAVAIVGVSK